MEPPLAVGAQPGVPFPVEKKRWHWRGRARSGGSSGVHAMKIKERDVAGASSGDRFIKHTRSGGGAQQQRPEEGGPESVSFRGLEAGRARTMGKIAARSIMVLQ